MIGCAPGGSCCAECAAGAPIVAAPVSLDGFGFWAQILAAAVTAGKTAATVAPHVAEIVAADRALDLDANSSAVPGTTAAEQALAIYRAQQARASFPGVLMTPAALIGVGAVAVALIAARR